MSIQKNSPSVLVSLLVGLTVLLLSVVGAGLYLNQIRQPDQPTTSKPVTLIDGYPFDPTPFQQGVMVGEVVVYLDDLNNTYNLMYPSTTAARSNLSNWEEVANKVTEYVILQNEGIKIGLFETPSDKRINQNLVNQSRKHVDSAGKTSVSGTALSLWFYNTDPPAMGVDKAKEVTYEQMSLYYPRLLSGELSMRDVAEIFKANTTLKEIDPSINGNAYVEFENVAPDQKMINDADLNTVVHDLKEGAYTKILTGKDYTPAEGWYEAYYVIFKATRRTDSDYSSVDDFLNLRKNEGLQIKLTPNV